MTTIVRNHRFLFFTLIVLIFLTGCAGAQQCQEQAKVQRDNPKIYSISCTNTKGIPEAPGSGAPEICTARMLPRQPTISMGSILGYGGDFNFSDVGEWSQVYIGKDPTPYYVHPEDVVPLC